MIQQRPCEAGGKNRWDGIPHLRPLIRWGSAEHEIVGVRLKPGTLPHGDCPHLRGMNEAVSIPGQMGHNRPARLVWPQATVLVIEDIRPVPHQVMALIFFQHISAVFPWFEQAKQLKIILVVVPRPMIENQAGFVPHPEGRVVQVESGPRI